MTTMSTLLRAALLTAFLAACDESAEPDVDDDLAAADAEDAIDADDAELSDAPDPALQRRCAALFEHIDFGGDRRIVRPGARVRWIGDLWNDQVSSIRVRPGCVLNAYEHIDFGGAHKSFLGIVPWVGDGWNDRISSYTCSCG